MTKVGCKCRGDQWLRQPTSPANASLSCAAGAGTTFALRPQLSSQQVYIVSRGVPEHGDSTDGASYSAVFVTDSLVVARTDAAEGPPTPQRGSASGAAADVARPWQSEPTSNVAAGSRAATGAASTKLDANEAAPDARRQRAKVGSKA